MALFIDELPRYLTYAEIADALARRFGARRAWPEETIILYWKTLSPARARQFSRLDRDTELRDYVDDRLDRLTLDELLAACLAAFGKERTPSRSALHRHALRRRAEL